MPRLTLRCDDRVLKDCVVDRMATIGRVADNTIVVDSAAVSGHHACVVRDGDRFIVEDLASTNGTFVNGKRVTRQPLRHGDVVRIGSHSIVFEEIEGEELQPAEEVERITSNPGDTVFLGGEKFKSLLTALKDTAEREAKAVAEAVAPRDAAVLRVLQGRADRAEYRLEARTCVVGSSESAQVRLRGWFKPKEALAIARNGGSYVATVLAGKTRINKQPSNGRHQLKDGDVLEVSGLTLEFREKSA
jgi:predicted component of type VI protein secretion system